VRSTPEKVEELRGLAHLGHVALAEHFPKAAACTARGSSSGSRLPVSRAGLTAGFCDRDPP
jgi:hypothetical protein